MICNKCQIEKNLDEFYINKATLSGHHHNCKDCTKEYMRDLYKRKKENKRLAKLDATGITVEAELVRKEFVSRAAFLTIEDVCAITSFSKSFIYDSVQKGDFPRPIKFGLKLARWIPGDIEQWIAGCVARRME